jgi:putative ABC transport system permease protein
MSVGISIFSVFLVVFVTMMYSVSKVKKENTADALKKEAL